MQISYRTYKIATILCAPAIYIWLKIRQYKGKEDKNRVGERLGNYKIKRPKGVLLWMHAASVGEVNSVLLLIEKINAEFPDVKILLTTGTVTSAQLVKKRLPNVLHQFVPVDTDEATNKFLRHFRPDIGFWIESELWPNLVMNARARGCFMVIINGRMSEKSYNMWQKYATLMIFDMLNCFSVVFAQTPLDSQRFKALGAQDSIYPGNLKYDSSVLPCLESELAAMKKQIGERPVWLAASTHNNEEEQIAAACAPLIKKYSDIVTIIAPRHPQRGEEIAKTISAYGKVSLRSRGDKIEADTNFYIADTLGELGLFYRLCEVVFMGGSLIEHGGQNPLEPARLRCCIITGTHTKNFLDMYNEMEELKICVRVKNATELTEQVATLIKDSDRITDTLIATKEWLNTKTGAIERIIKTLAPIFTPVTLEKE